MGSGRKTAKRRDGVSEENAAELYSLERVLRNGQSGFYILTASPRTQTAIIKRCAGESLGVYDFAKGNRDLSEISTLMEREPERKAYAFLNFQLALWGENEWNIDAVRRLNFSRNALAKRKRALIFCMTAEADDLLSRRAYDFYDYISLSFHFEDEEDAPELETVAARLPDKSVGVHVVEVDYTRPDEELLNLAISLGHQADEADNKARYADALDLLQKQLEIRERILGKEHPDTAESYNNIGLLYSRQGDYAKALEWYQKALRIAEKALGAEHPNTATAYDNIGTIDLYQGNYAEALEWLKKALRIREKVLGAEHPNTAISDNNIGSAYYEQGDYAEALKWYQKTLRVEEKVLGIEHPRTAQSYITIGLVCYAQGDYAEALAWYQKALRIYEKVLGAEHPYTATSYNNIGGVYDSQGDYAKALEWYQKALQIREKTLGAEHPDTATSYHYIGTVYFKQGDYGEALKWLEKALAVRLKTLGAEHPKTQNTQEWIDKTKRLMSGAE